MTSKTLSSIAGGGGISKPVAFASAEIAAGASGDILAVTAAAGQYLKLTYLITGSFTTEAGMTLTVDGVNLFTGATLADSTPNAIAGGSVFGVASGYGNTNVQASARLLAEINCLSFTVTKDAGSTIQPIDYAYVTLEAL
jgi:predicted methyltransferase